MGSKFGDGGAGYNIVAPNGTELIRLLPLNTPNVPTNADYFATALAVANLATSGDIFNNVTIENSTIVSSTVYPTMDPNVTSTGSNQATGYVISKQNTIVTTVPAGTGVTLPTGLTVSAVGIVVNADTANGLLTFYPPSDGAGLVNNTASVKIPAGSMGLWFVNAAGNVYLR